jgi:PHP family Zn ribbon phosphoesterase
VRFSPEETKKNNTICPKCRKKLTVGVMNRVDQLADRPHGFVPENAIPFKNLIPLDEIIADAKGVGKAAQSVLKEYHQVVSRFGTEFAVLATVPREELRKGASPRLVEGIMRVRQGKVGIQPGYDGEYGTIKIFSEDDTEVKKDDAQLQLF